MDTAAGHISACHIMKKSVIYADVRVLAAPCVIKLECARALSRLSSQRLAWQMFSAQRDVCLFNKMNYLGKEARRRY